MLQNVLTYQHYFGHVCFCYQRVSKTITLPPDMSPCSGASIVQTKLIGILLIQTKQTTIKKGKAEK